MFIRSQPTVKYIISSGGLVKNISQDMVLGKIERDYFDTSTIFKNHGAFIHNTGARPFGFFNLPQFVYSSKDFFLLLYTSEHFFNDIFTFVTVFGDSKPDEHSI
jgi:hypothetical protein